MKNFFDIWVRIPYRNFIVGIRNLITWFPIIWKDRDWDDYYIWEILKFKIRNQSKYIGGRDLHTLAKRDAEIMMTCVNLIDKVQSEYYNTEYIDYIDNEFKFIPYDKNPKLYELKINTLTENLDDYFKKYPLVYKKVTNGDVRLKGRENDKEKIAMIMAHDNHERAKEILFKLLNNNIERWWD